MTPKEIGDLRQIKIIFSKSNWMIVLIVNAWFASLID
jgi:hypothetical protein